MHAVKKMKYLRLTRDIYVHGVNYTFFYAFGNKSLKVNILF